MTISQIPAAGPTHERLRAATAALHEASHRLEAFRELVDPGLTLPRYRRLMGRLWGVVAAVEEAAAAGPALPGAIRWRAPDLARDLQALGLDRSEVEALPRPCLPPPETEAAALGAVYVIQGSRHGGAMIAQQVERNLGVGAGNGAAFFASAGSDPSDWPNFLGLLERSTASPAGRGEAVAGAVMTFRQFLTWMA